MVRFEGPAARRLRERAARRTRWEIALLALAVGHWAYHKNREWDTFVKELAIPRGGRLDLDDVEDFDDLAGEGRWPAASPRAIDLTRTNDALGASAAG